MSFRAASILLPLLASCAFSDSHFIVDYPTKALPAAGQRVSVLGVFKDGRMRQEAWEELGPRLKGVLGDQACELAFTDRLRGEDEELYERLDRDIKDNGISKDTLTTFAPRAQGHAILAITVLGEPPPPGPGLGAHTRGMDASSSARTRRAAARNLLPGEDRPVQGGLDVTATLYSIEAHDYILSLNLHYTGTSLEEGYRRLADKLVTLMPEARCAGWKWKP